ncbi:MAG TPA: hypothetical protein VFX21_14935 [Acidimicrobiia bacterium]|nr:hypothetical protein [Acidimicrobiia bacterium]
MRELFTRSAVPATSPAVAGTAQVTQPKLPFACDDRAWFCLHTWSGERAHDSWANVIASVIESLQGGPVDIRRRDGEWVRVTVPTVPNDWGWRELQRIEDCVRLEPVGWVPLDDIVAVHPATP